MRVQRARYFLAAVETGSLRAAAARCGVSQPSIGQQIRLLEEELDVVLLTRSRNGVRPTPSGQAMVEPLARLVAAEESVHLAAADSGGTYRGEVAIGAVSVVAESVVAPLVGRLHKQHPHLRFTLLESSSTEVEAAVAAGDLDFGVITARAQPPGPGLQRISLFTAPLGALVRSDHVLAERPRVSWQELETWPIVTMRAGTVVWERLHENIARPNIVVQAMSHRMVTVMVAQGAGVGILGPFDTSRDLSGLRWLPLIDTEPIGFCVVQRADSRPSPAALVVRRLIAEQAAELLVGTVSVDQA